MSNSCKGICKRYAKRSKIKKMENKKYCTCCERNIEWEGIRCPCCSSTLRVKVHSPKYAKIIAAEKSERLGY